MNAARPLSIKHWSPDDRPREKLLLKGKSALTDAELIAILLGSGTSALSAVDLAKRVLSGAGHNLHELGGFSVKDLVKIRGIGEAKAISIVAALELGRRRKESMPDEKPRVVRSKDAYDIMKPHLADLPHEAFWVLLLNRANRVTKKMQVSQGGVTGTVADPKIIFKFAVEELASGLILAHNHPSGNSTPSQSDISLTRKLKEGAKLLDMEVLDHIIIAGHNYLSFADEGLL